MDTIKVSQWKDISRRLCNQGKKNFLQLVKRSVREVGTKPDEYGLSYSTKSILITSMALNTNSKWEVSQLTATLK